MDRLPKLSPRAAVTTSPYRERARSLNSMQRGLDMQLCVVAVVVHHSFLDKSRLVFRPRRRRSGRGWPALARTRRK